MIVVDVRTGDSKRKFFGEGKDEAFAWMWNQRGNETYVQRLMRKMIRKIKQAMERTVWHLRMTTKGRSWEI